MISLLSTSNASNSCPIVPPSDSGSKCGLQTSNISINWELTRKCQAPPQTWIRNSGGGGQQSLFSSLPDDSDVYSSLRTTALGKCWVWHYTVAQTSFLPFTAPAFSDDFSLSSKPAAYCPNRDFIPSHSMTPLQSHPVHIPVLSLFLPITSSRNFFFLLILISQHLGDNVQKSQPGCSWPIEGTWTNTWNGCKLH